MSCTYVATGPRAGGGDASGDDVGVGGTTHAPRYVAAHYLPAFSLHRVSIPKVLGHGDHGSRRVLLFQDTVSRAWYVGYLLRSEEVKGLGE